MSVSPVLDTPGAVRPARTWRLGSRLDDGGAALDILSTLLPEWRARGLTFKALPREIC